MDDIIDHSNNEDLYKKMLKDHHLPIDTPIDDLKMQRANTQRLVDIFNIIIDESRKS